MNRPGLSVETRPAVMRLRRDVEQLMQLTEQLHQQPVAENLAAFAMMTVKVFNQSVSTLESVGLTISEAGAVYNAAADDPEMFRMMLQIIRRQR